MTSLPCLMLRAVGEEGYRVTAAADAMLEVVVDISKKEGSDVTVFSSLEAAIKEGYTWYCYSKDVQLHVVEFDSRRPGGLRIKALAFAVPSQEERERLG